MIDIYLANGHISEITLLTDTYKVSAYPRQSDQPAPIQWRATTEGITADGSIVESLSGTGKYYGGVTGAVKFQVLTPNMLQYLYNTIMGGRPVSKTTVYLWHPRLGATPYHVVMKFPLGDGELQGVRLGDDYTANVTLQFTQGVIANYGRSFGRGFSTAWG